MKRYLLSLAFVLFAVPAWGQIKSPGKVDAYQPIVLESVMEASSYLWDFPENVHYLQADPKSRSVHVWAPPGKHRVKLVTIDIDWEKKEVNTVTHRAVFEVIGGGPGPEPPGPEPTAFKQKIAAALAEVPGTHSGYARQLGGVFSAIASEATAKPGSWDPATMVAEMKTRSLTTLPLASIKPWQPFIKGWAKAMSDLKLQNDDLDGHIKCFNQTSEVLKNAKVQEKAIRKEEETGRRRRSSITPAETASQQTASQEVPQRSRPRLRFGFFR